MARNAKDEVTKMVWMKSKLGRLYLCEILIFGKRMDMNVCRGETKIGK